jgi:NAD(P)-dependent dehydrogenase (short-subunit alcohol dehydrogenase family)
MNAANQVVLVAGVGEGLGSAIARRFARAGHPVAMIARNGDRLARFVGGEVLDGHEKLPDLATNLPSESRLVWSLAFECFAFLPVESTRRAR